MVPERYAEVLAEEIANLDARIEALQPDWQVPTLQQSYLHSAVYAALVKVCDTA